MKRRGPFAAASLAALLMTCAWVPAQVQSPAGLDEMRAFAKKLLVEEHYAEAVNAYITIAEETPLDPRSQYDVASVMAFLQMYADAAPRVEKAIALDPDNTLYLELAGLTYMQLRRYPEAFDATLRGARLGDVKAMYSVAGMYEHGRGTAASDGDALEWLERAASDGHMGAMDKMAKVYREGLYGQPPDPQREKAWEQALEKALSQ